MKFLTFAIVLSNLFIFLKSEELSCQEVQETICKRRINYTEELIPSCLEENRYWKKYDQNKLDLIVNPFSEFLLTLEPLGEYKKKSTTVDIHITQLQQNEELLCRSNFEMKVQHTFWNSKIY